MLKSLYSVFFLLSVANIQFARAQYTEDFRAKAVLERSYTDVKGSPYLFDDWSVGVVKLVGGATYKDMLLKYDQLAGELIFKDKSGKVLTFADPVLEFKLTGKDNAGRLFKSGYKSADNTERYFYEVLYDGGTILLKDPKKNIVEHRAYNSSTAVRSIVETPAYYLQMNGQLVKIKKDKKSIISALGYQPQLEKYIQENKLNLKDDQDVAKLISYYDDIKS